MSKSMNQRTGAGEEVDARQAKKRKRRKDAELADQDQKRSPDEPKPLAEDPGDPPRPRARR